LSGLIGDLPPSARLLDIGCGGGENLMLLRKHAAPQVELTGIDVSSEAVARATSLLQDGAKIFQGTAVSLPFPTGSFDRVTMFGVMEHIREHDKVILEISRILVPGGRLYISTSNYYSLVRWTTLFRKTISAFPFGYQRDWSERQIRSWLGQYFNILSIGVVSADWDMPMAKVVDGAFGLFNSAWGRYLFIKAEK
jgi:ubiquinone/menaquinone biosynthesis C-methylase UbiE